MNDREWIGWAIEQLPNLELDPRTINNAKNMLLPYTAKDCSEKIIAFKAVVDIEGFEDVIEWITEEELVLGNINTLKKFLSGEYCEK